MQSASLTPGISEAQFDAFLQQRDEPEWLTAMRRKAWDRYQQLPLPTRADEEWARTDIRLFHFDKFFWDLEADREACLPEPALAAGVELGGQTVALNGKRHGDTDFDQGLSEQGVLFGDLSVLARHHSDLVEQHLLCRAVDPHYDKFAALHAACWDAGTFLYVPPHVTVSLPFHQYSVLGDQGIDMSHTLIVLGEGAEATFLSETGSCDPAAPGLHCGATEVIQGPGSRLRFVSLQDWSPAVWHFAHQKAMVARDASLQWTVGALGARVAKVNQHVELTGAGAECQVNGVLFAEGKQHLSYHTHQHHAAPHCRSDFLYKAALQDQSRTVWRGMIKVDPDAQKTDGYQRNDNLLLSPSARADAIPGLEIEADDVRCTHGSTTGSVDEEPIFYARCRGFTRKEAVRMIVSGFFQQVFDRITIESVRASLGESIAKRVRDYE